MKISAYIPCHNNHPTLAAAIESIRRQTVTVDEFFVVDDGSSDGSAELAESMGLRVIRLGKNLGRGGARARAMTEASGDLVLCCDATTTLRSDFLQRALVWLTNPRVAGVCGRITQPPASNAVERWRGRHLFKISLSPAIRHDALLVTAAALVRTSSVIAVGNYDARLRHTEDGELGTRLLAAGWDVIHDPGLEVVCISRNTLGKILERYWRWHAGVHEAMSLKGYLRQIAYSIKVMARQDFEQRDTLGAVISLLSPHYQFWRSCLGKRNKSRTWRTKDIAIDGKQPVAK